MSSRTEVERGQATHEECANAGAALHEGLEVSNAADDAEGRCCDNVPSF